MSCSDKILKLTIRLHLAVRENILQENEFQANY